jgi:hypothetical protein
VQLAVRRWLLFLLLSYQLGVAKVADPDLGSESLGCPLQSLRDSFLANHLVREVVVAIRTVASAWDAIESRGKALTIQFETLGIAAVATAERGPLVLRLLGLLVRELRRVVGRVVDDQIRRVCRGRLRR